MIADVEFRLIGKQLPVDHGYLLSSAIARIIPQIHGDQSVGIHAINGPYIGDRLQLVTSKSILRIRIDATRVHEFLPLAGKTLHVGSHNIHVGVPMIRALTPTAKVYSRLVVIKGFTEPDTFLEAARRQIEELGIKGNPVLIDHNNGEAMGSYGVDTGTRSKFLRRTIRIHDKEIVGFALRVDNLQNHESLLLQETGIGGRRRFGCGLFLPIIRKG
jgi:CRISPR-associated protein Cas6